MARWLRPAARRISEWLAALFIGVLALGVLEVSFVSTVTGHRDDLTEDCDDLP